MEWLIWVIVIVLIIAIVWWLLNRNSGKTAGSRDAAGTDQVTSSPSRASASMAGASGSSASAAAPAAAGATGIASTAGAGEAARTEAPSPAGAPPVPPDSSPAAQANPEDVEPDIESWDAATSRPPAGAHVPSGGDVDDWDDDEDKAEWDTQWSEAGSAAATPQRAAEPPSSAAGTPAHHPEYTEQHAATLPGAESAAAEALDAEAETQQRIQSSAATEAAASHGAEPVGHETMSPRAAGAGAMANEPPRTEAAEAPDTSAAAAAPTHEGAAGAPGQPYGEGSATPSADGSGPEGFTVKADTGSMTYYDEDSSGYNEANAEVWFLSPAHAEAAGFRAPRRTRR
jgi:hypothetical protein